MHIIPFTRFTLPNGRQSDDSTEVGDAEFAKFNELSALGFRMTVELLQNGWVSMCIEDPRFGDFDSVVCENGPKVPVKLSEMLLRFEAAGVPAWREEMA